MPSLRTFPSRRSIEALLNAALAAQRRDSLGDLGPRHPRLRQWVWQCWLQGVVGTLGDAVAPPEAFGAPDDSGAPDPGAEEYGA